MSVSPQSSRRGFTLVELLIAIAIIAILAALVLGVAARAGGVAREAKTKSMIARLHTLLMDRYDKYRNVRVGLRPNWETNLRIDNNNDGYSDRCGIDLRQLNLNVLQYPAAGRLAATYERMRLEMPQSYEEMFSVSLPPGNAPLPPITRNMVINLLQFLEDAPIETSIYLREYERARLNGVTTADLVANQSAECLYLIMMHSTGDGEARSLFRETDTIDTDGDGIPEFADGWGNPISYVRWAAGFDSDAQLSVPELTSRLDGRDVFVAEGAGEAIDADRNSLDLFGIDRPRLDNQGAVSGLRGWRLRPLIVSGGSDGSYGLQIDSAGSPQVDPRRSDPYGPSGYASAANGDWLGSVFDRDAAADNQHNHQLATLSRSR